MYPIYNGCFISCGYTTYLPTHANNNTQHKDTTHAKRKAIQNTRRTYISKHNEKHKTKHNNTK